MSDKEKAHNDGERDGSKYNDQGTFDKVLNPSYHPPSNPGQKESYDKGHKNGRR